MPVSRKLIARLALPLFLTCIAIAASSCRTDPVGPGATQTAIGPGEPVLDRDAPEQGALATRLPYDDGHPTPPGAPKILRLDADVKQGMLVVRGQLAQRPRVNRYDPEHAGGWAIQVFVDSDPTNDGYWMGFDYVVRGTEWTPSTGAFVTRRITLEEQYPGGWGPECGTASFLEKQRQFEVSIPLSAIGGGGSDIHLAVETYATVGCLECESGVTQEFVQDAFTSVPHHPGTESDQARSVRPIASSYPSPGPHRTANADPRLALGRLGRSGI